MSDAHKVSPLTTAASEARRYAELADWQGDK